MLLIHCPWCGLRDESEYRYGGQAQLSYPDDPATLDDAAWGAYLFIRANPKGWFLERWAHSQGCRQWFNVWRHTTTNEIGGSYPLDQTPAEPELSHS